MARKRVVLVEDDASLRRFVAMALEEFDIELVQCTSVAHAVAELQAQPAHLVITDLMMPGESGLVLIERLRRDPGLGAGAQLAVFSAGLTEPVRAQLAGLGIWRFLAKPVSIHELERCVLDALALPSPRAVAATPLPDVSAPSAAERAVVRHFGGNKALYEAFQAACQIQFPNDITAGDSAAQASDWPALRRVAHSLKSVLFMLGHDKAARMARALEDHCAAFPEPGNARALWADLRNALLRLV